MDVREVTTLAEIEAAGALFDAPPTRAATLRFLAQPSHHLLVAYEAGVPAGFVSGVETIHPDKGTEMFLYELAVDPAHRGRGIGRALVDALAEVARSAGCYGMWVATDEDNAAAVATYRAAGAERDGTFVMLSWSEASLGDASPP